MAQLNAAVVCFSRAGENLYGGACQFLNQGNTLLLARQVAQRQRLTLIQLQPVHPYETTYQTVLQRTQLELRQRQLPVLQPVSQRLAQMPILYLGFPVWWGHLPRPVVTFLKQNVAPQVTLYPFCTHEGSRFGATLTEIQQVLPQATLQSGLPIRGTHAWQAQAAVDYWLKK